MALDDIIQQLRDADVAIGAQITALMGERGRIVAALEALGVHITAAGVPLPEASAGQLGIGHVLAEQPSKPSAKRQPVPVKASPAPTMSAKARRAAPAKVKCPKCKLLHRHCLLEHKRRPRLDEKVPVRA